MEVIELSKQLKTKFKKIWRCADSNKWQILKESDLLSFDWIDKNVNYKGKSKKEIGRGQRAIFPFVNNLKKGDLIFVMGKNSFQGIAICKSEYEFNGWKLNMDDSGDKPAVKVDYIFKSPTSVNHNIDTHNNPTTFAGINQYNFGLENVLTFLKSSLPVAYDALVNQLNQDLLKKNYKEKYTNWLYRTKKEGSKKADSYIRAIDILSEVTNKEIFEEDNQSLLKELYKDLINEQEKIEGKYYYKKAPSYGSSRFYSAAIKSYSIFIEELNKYQNIKTQTDMPLNQILFGPPGTGKTYNTINKALEIINDDEVKSLDWSDRTKVKALFDKKMKERQIVFTTFHQSMSYEEFIEGIKPIVPKEDELNLIYKVEPGIFKKMSIEASFNIARLRMSKEITETLDFSNLYDMFIEEVQEKLINNEEVELKTKSGGTVLIDSVSQQGNIIIKHHNGTRTYTVSKPRLTKLQSAIESLDSVSNINDEFREVIGGSNSSAYWSVLNAIKQITKRVKVNTEAKAYTFEDKVEVVKKMNKDDFNNVKGTNYVLIIDEINRGNVSQIFGELITLIEEDKRLGKNEALEITLPYSKDKFGVPPNLYIIGTMNTADRSVEALDTALRRRFSFTEMPPTPELLSPSAMLTRLFYKYEDVDWDDKEYKIKETQLIKLLGIDEKKEAWGKRKKTWNNEMAKQNQSDLTRLNYMNDLSKINFQHLLNIINKRIEVLLDRDHAIGHSYFIRINSKIEFIEVFYENIIPLLQEYFYGDYAKIGAVLGKGFVHINEEKDTVLFAEGFTDEIYNEKDIYHIIDYRPNQPNYQYVQEGMTFEKAIHSLMNKTTDVNSESEL